MSYREMRKMAKSLSVYKTPRLTLFGNAVNLVKGGGPSVYEAGGMRTHPTNNNG